MKLSEIEVGDMIKTFDDEIGVVIDTSSRIVYLSTIDGDKKIHLKDIKKIRFIKPMCLKHHKRYCEICNQSMYEKS